MSKEVTVEEGIISGNKIIAEFMGCNPHPFKNEGGSGFDVRLNGVPAKGYMSYSLATYGTKRENIDKLLEWPFFYHTSWDWLMPVVEKIETIPRVLGVHILEKSSVIKIGELLGEKDHVITVQICDTKIEAVWQAVIQFIQWYNQQKLKP